MRLAIGTYIKFQDKAGVDVGYSFQNFFFNETRTYESVDYLFANFGFSGASIDLSAANISASLVFSQNALSSVVIKQACDQFWIISVRSVWLDPDTLLETSTFLEETYSAISFEHDLTQLILTIGNPLDAVQTEVPQRILNQQLVGYLPTTGAININ